MKSKFHAILFTQPCFCHSFNIFVVWDKFLFALKVIILCQKLLCKRFLLKLFLEKRLEKLFIGLFLCNQCSQTIVIGCQQCHQWGLQVAQRASKYLHWFRSYWGEPLSQNTLLSQNILLHCSRMDDESIDIFVPSILPIFIFSNENIFNSLGGPICQYSIVLKTGTVQYKRLVTKRYD